MRDETWRKLHATPERCTDCGEIVPVGGWPFCASTQNPEGHAKGAYTWKMQMGMKVQGWTRRQR